MNKELAKQVKEKCKDTGLSEAYLDSITENLGGDVADDSTDNAAIAAAAERIANTAKLAQGEANRWVDKNKQKNNPPAPIPQPTPNADDEPPYFKAFREAQEKRLKLLEEQNASLIAERAKNDRAAKVTAAFDKHKIPADFRQYVNPPESVEDDKIDEYVAGMAQKFVTAQLPGMDTGGRQVASTEETKAAADAFFNKHVQLPKKD